MRWSSRTPGIVSSRSPDAPSARLCPLLARAALAARQGCEHSKRAPGPSPLPFSGLSASESLVDAISSASTTAALAEALREVEQWQWTSDQEAGMKRCKTYVPEQPALAAFYVSSVNEWKLLQPRVLVLTSSSYFRVKYDQKSGKAEHRRRTIRQSRLKRRHSSPLAACKVEHYRKTPLRDVLSLEKTAGGRTI